MNSSFLVLPQSKIYRKLYRVYEWLCAITNPVWWLLDPKSKTVLDVGCGQGYPMQMLKMVRSDLKITGVDLFKDYLKEAKKSGIYEKLVNVDVNKMKFKDKSFDTVICLQVVEHQTKKNALKLIKNMERMAKKQVIIATPLGYFDHPEMDGNVLQRHLSGWDDSDFTQMGYRVTHQSLSLFFGNDGIVHKNIPSFIKALIFILDHLLTPIYFLFPKTSDYWIVACKNIKENDR